MDLEYNGVRMELMQLDRVARDAVYSEDGSDLLYIKWNIAATCVYGAGGRPVGTAARTIKPHTIDDLYGRPGRNPDQLLAPASGPNNSSFSQEQNTIGDQAVGNGYNAVFTDAELRTRLWIPRRKLKIGAYDSEGRHVTWLESPKSGFNSDIAGGPRPISVDVVTAVGEGTTFGVHFQIETSTSACPSGADQYILSHRWQMTHDHDEDNYLTRIIAGTVVFNQAFVQSSNLYPDTFRNQLFHPIPLGFKRKLGPITLSEDGSTLRYVIFDTDQTVVFDAGDSGATRMEIVENLQYSQPWRVIGGGSSLFGNFSGLSGLFGKGD